MNKPVSGTTDKIPVLATCWMMLGFMILCGLGSWQVYRLQWKTHLMSDLRAAYQVEDADYVQPLTAMSLRKKKFAYGSVSGRLLWDKALLLGPRVLDKKIGSSVMVPLLQDNGHAVIVNMGWSDQPLEALQEDAQGAEQEVKIDGLARMPYWSSFTPKNEPDRDVWYRPDVAGMAQAKNLDHVFPFIVYAYHAQGADYLNVMGLPRNDRWWPHNNHAQYVAFWFSMAAVLLLIYWLRFFKYPVQDEDGDA